MTKILLVEDDKSLSEIYSVRLRAEGYEGVQVDFIDENKEPAKTQPFAGIYYYVPSIFMDGKKLYEAQPGQSYDKIFAEVKHAFDAARTD